MFVRFFFVLFCFWLGIHLFMVPGWVFIYLWLFLFPFFFLCPLWCAITVNFHVPEIAPCNQRLLKVLFDSDTAAVFTLAGSGDIFSSPPPVLGLPTSQCLLWTVVGRL